MNDCAGLVSLYNVTAAAGTPLDWPLDASLCTWNGVFCDADGRASSLIPSALYLQGSVPSELSRLDRLKKLWLDYNTLSGTVPPQLGRVNSSLTDLWLPFNSQLSGTVPPQLGRLPSISLLFLYSNRMSGTMPPVLSSAGSITQLDLTETLISGTLPVALGKLTRLSLIDTYNSSLSGTLPPELLGQITSIETLGFGETALSGTLPTELGRLTAMSNLILNEIRLSGTVPDTICSLFAPEGNLFECDLADNTFACPLPACGRGVSAVRSASDVKTKGTLVHNARELSLAVLIFGNILHSLPHRSHECILRPHLVCENILRIHIGFTPSKVQCSKASRRTSQISVPEQCKAN